MSKFKQIITELFTKKEDVIENGQATPYRCDHLLGFFKENSHLVFRSRFMEEALTFIAYKNNALNNKRQPDYTFKDLITPVNGEYIDFIRFNHCPNCGKKLDWNVIIDESIEEFNKTK